MADPLVVLYLPIKNGFRKRQQGNLQVVIWRTLKDMREHCYHRTPGSRKFWNEALACFLGASNHRKKKLPHDGEIHLALRYVNFIVFSHELEHFSQWWTERHEDWPLDMDAKERMAGLIGGLSGAFWAAYMDIFRRKP